MKKLTDEELLKQAVDLLRWLAPLLPVRDANGHRSKRFCILCDRVARRKEMHNGKVVTVAGPCRHDEIYQYLT